MIQKDSLEEETRTKIIGIVVTVSIGMGIVFIAPDALTWFFEIDLENPSESEVPPVMVEKFVKAKPVIQWISGGIAFLVLAIGVGKLQILSIPTTKKS